MKYSTIYSATQQSAKRDTILYNSIIQSLGASYSQFIDHKFITDNKESLAKVYNDSIEHSISRGDQYLFFIHDDVIINCQDFYSRVNKAFETFDIIGLAGNTSIDLGYHNKPMLWHLISERRDQLGCVAHGDKDNYIYTSFGPLNKRALMIDGLFIGIKLEALGNLRFDENNPAKFHFYDLIFSMDAAKAKLKTGVVDIPVIHSSPGLRSFTDEWKAGEKYFKSKYSAYSGSRITL